MSACGAESTILLRKDDKHQGIERDRWNGERVASADQKRSFWSDATRSQIALVAFATLSNTSVYICQDIPAPFLAREITAKGGENVNAAAIMNSPYLASAFTSLIFGNFQSGISTKRFISSGLLIVAITQCSLVALDYMDGASLLVFGVMIRAIQGIGSGIYNVAMLTLLWQELPDYVAKLYGVIKASTAFGYFLGAVVGGQLYGIRNRMMLPFIASGGFTGLLAVAGWAFLRNELNKTEVSNSRTWHYILNPTAILALGLAGVTGGSTAIYDASFTSYAQTLGISVALAGWLMSVNNAVTLIWSPIMFYLYSIKHLYRELVMVCCFIGQFGINFVFATNQPTMGPLVVGVGFYGLFVMTLQNFAFVELVYRASGDDNKIKSDRTFRGKISGTWYFMLSISQFAFGLFGTGLQTVLPYYLSQTVTTLVTTSLTCAISLVIYIYHFMTKYNRIS